MIEVKNLTKKYSDKYAINDVSFSINKGEIVGFLGPNGAGKSTTMNIMTGYISATSGSVSIDGYDIVDSPIQAKSRIGYLPEQPPLYFDMTVCEYLSFVYQLKKIKLDKDSHIAQVMRMVKITHVQNRLIRNLSKGYKQRVGLAQALLGNPEFLILDEPTVGLDPKQITEIRDVILSLGKEHTILISSHILQEISAVCQRVIIINDGKIVAEDTIENLSGEITGGNSYTAQILGDNDDVLRAIASVEGITDAAPIIDDKYEFKAEGKETLERLFYALAESKMPITMLKSNALTLEEVFLHVTGGRKIKGEK
ncbi:MAG: ATP-binding cassette domain-containing protein [Eubacteriales bacterium]|nr:ATP-binding cassette domain-containing protein [Eubacteriales bacterium]